MSSINIRITKDRPWVGVGSSGILKKGEEFPAETATSNHYRLAIISIPVGNLYITPEYYEVICPLVELARVAE